MSVGQNSRKTEKTIPTRLITMPETSIELRCLSRSGRDHACGSQARSIDSSVARNPAVADAIRAEARRRPIASRERIRTNLGPGG